MSKWNPCIKTSQNCSQFTNNTSFKLSNFLILIYHCLKYEEIGVFVITWADVISDDGWHDVIRHGQRHGMAIVIAWIGLGNVSLLFGKKPSPVH
jgi:hypothetical protein